MTNILITGLTGRSGKHFGELLMQNRIPHVTALVRSCDKFYSLFGNNSGIACVQGDLQDTVFLQKTMQQRNTDTVFHIAGIGFSLNIVKSAVGAGCVRRLILVHTAGIYSKYKAASAGYLHIEEEVYALAKAADIDLTILRPTMIYGTLDDKNISVFIRMVDKLRLFPLVGGGKYDLQPIHHSDLGKAYFQVLTSEAKTRNRDYCLSGGTVITLKDMLGSISTLLGKNTVFFYVPFPLAFAAAAVLYYLTAKRIDLREKVQRLVEPRAYPHTQASIDFGYAPMPFYDGLQAEVQAYKNSTSGIQAGSAHKKRE